MAAFSKSVERFIQLYREELDFVLQSSTERVFTQIGKKSNSVLKAAPVLTGEFVADWDVAIGHWPTDTKPPVDPGKRKTASRMRETIRKANFGDAIFFENTDPVARRLEFGFSKKAPSGMIRLAARSWRRHVKNASRAANRKIEKKFSDIG